MNKLTSCVAAALLSVFAVPASAQMADFKPVTEAILTNPDPAD